MRKVPCTAEQGASSERERCEKGGMENLGKFVNRNIDPQRTVILGLSYSATGSQNAGGVRRIRVHNQSPSHNVSARKERMV